MAETKSKALFLDRDGVINVDFGYVHEKEKFVFKKGIFKLCKKYQEQGFEIIVVTNQSGIARGFFSERDFQYLSHWMLTVFEKRGVLVRKVYHCPHHPDITGNCDCRKPEAGLFLMAKEEFDIDLSKSIMFGDSERDIVAAKKAGIRECFRVNNKSQVLEYQELKMDGAV